MTENDLVSRWGNERSMYFSWAEFIQNEITNKLSNFEYLIKIPVTPRLKADQSLIDKALYRRKGYANPYLDMTDKVGLRFVTLLTAHIKKIESIIAESENWLYSKDKDFEREREDNPFEFAYQSIHYVLRPKCDFMHGDMFISHEVSCEVQIRTLLQHAHAELTHDNLYKPNFSAKPQSQRLAAKSMALIEVADDFFEQVVHASGESYQNQSKLMDQLSRLYLKETGKQPEVAKANQLLVDFIDAKFNVEDYVDIEKALLQKGFIFECIASRYDARHIYRQPSILLVYYLALIRPSQTKELDLLPDSDLRGIYTDLGHSYDDY